MENLKEYIKHKKEQEELKKKKKIIKNIKNVSKQDTSTKVKKSLDKIIEKLKPETGFELIKE